MRTFARYWFLAVALLLGACSSAPVALPGTGAEGQAMREHPERFIVVAVNNPQETLATQAGSTLAGYAASQRYSAGSAARATVAALKRDYRLSELTGWPITALRLHCVVLGIAPGESRDDLLKVLAEDKRVELAQPLQNFGTLADNPAGYNDPYVGLQRGFIEIGAAEAHQASRGKGVRIAVIDTGVDATHPDLQGRIEATRNFVDRDEAQFNRDRHGTEVAGIIAAVANNGRGIVGIAPEASLTVHKACWQNASGAGAQCNSYTLALALAASLDAGSQIINLSLGGPADALLGRLVEHALKQGRIVVGAMPTDGRLSGFPAGVPGVIVVDSTGRGAARRDVLHAPGRDILTLEPGGHYDFGSGSSLAAAHVSAVAALLLSADPGLDATAMRALLQRSQEPVDVTGSIDACAALAGLRHAATCTPRRKVFQAAGAPREATSPR
jgi:subtilisin family serine protease